MDHRISKDMISSGMIPSGEKNQEDLSRTQYGTAPSPNALADVYKKMYEHHQKDKDGNTIPHDGEELKEYAQLIPLATKLFSGAAKTVGSNVVKGGLKKTLTRTGIKLGGKTGGQMVKTAIEKPLQTAANVSYASNMMPQTSSGKDGTKKTSSISASADLFDIVKGQLLDEGLTEEEIRDIMLTLTPDEILKEIEESSMSAGSSDGHYHDGGDGVFRSKQQIGNMFNKNIPTKKQTGGKVDKMTRKSINTSARELGIQGPTTLKQSVEPKGETI